MSILVESQQVLLNRYMQNQRDIFELFQKLIGVLGSNINDRKGVKAEKCWLRELHKIIPNL